MPESEVRRIVAFVPSRSGAYGSCTSTLTAAWLSGVSSMLLTEPTRRPPTCTSLSGTSWPAFSNRSVYCVPPLPRNSSSHAASRIASARASTAAARAIVTDDPPTLPGSEAAVRAGPGSLHPQGSLRCAGQEPADELVVEVEQLVGRAGLVDPALPEHRDVLGHAPGRHAVVGDDHVGAAVLLVDLLDQLAQQRGADRVEAGVGLVEQHDVGVE